MFTEFIQYLTEVQELSLATYWASVSLVLIAVVFFIFVISSLAREGKPVSDFWILFLSLLMVLAIRIPTLTYGESNPDESQWLASVITIKADTLGYFKDFYVYDFTRFMTIFPIWLLSVSGIALGFLLLKIAGIIFSFICIVIYYFFIKEFFNNSISTLATFILALYMATYASSDYIAYNSETPAMTFLLIFVFAFHRSNMRPKKALYPILAGLFSVLALFTKEQTLLIVGSCGTYCLLSYLLTHQYRQALWFLAGGISTFTVFLAPFAIPGNFHALLDWAGDLSTYINHSKGHTLSGKLGFLFIHNNILFYLVPAVACVFLLLFTAPRKALMEIVDQKKPVSFLLGLFYLISLYTVVFPSYLFIHYSMLFILPSALLIAWMLHLLYSLPSKNILIVISSLMYLLLAQSGFNEVRAELQWRLSHDRMYYAKSTLSKLILQYGSPGERLMVWGWDCRLFVDTGMLRASRYWYTYFLSPVYPDQFKDKVAARFAEDFLRYHPRLIVELVGGGWAKEAPALNQVAPVQHIVETRYSLVKASEAYRIYQLKIPLDN